MSKIRIVIADDHAILRDGVRALLKQSEDFDIVAEAGNGNAAIEACRREKPDVVIMDINMPGLGGIEATLALRKEMPTLRILILTQYDDREYIRRLLKAGVAGYILKKSAGSALSDAVRAVARGGLVLDPEVAREAMTDYTGGGAHKGADPYDALTDREKQVLKLLAEGKSNKEVATELGISVKTAMSHREHIMEKLDLHNRTDLVKFAVRQGVIRVE
jgi:DNA-binding NarL/FixJ family response regulator